ncbi:DUF1223 domain-containing protein [Endozoicomonas sp. OPT23]|uniref:DUF1223 domain-containing protein n=1 Tax=Endozoicomonas sp. OPT23 TaxID=2072845 RepID=UPI00129A2229|nr:DUF1223 domain-containing protein [Endozoicomonas sp. OPT23]MRI34924.1 DUF1223 domain-containing protein [Endozoicomonas sp. OPT23]
MMKWIKPLLPIYLLLSALSATNAYSANNSTIRNIKLDSGLEKNHLLELFSSEGCSSCPPADRFVSELQTSPELWNKWVPVVYQVGYWDYLGWPDPFAKPEHQQKQYAYRRSGRANGVYTPGFFIDGQEWRGFFRRGRTLPEIKPTSAGRLTADVKQANAMLNISASYASTDKQPKGYILNWALTGLDRETEVNKGENAQKKLHHDFVVLESGFAHPDKKEWQLNVPLNSHPVSGNLALSLWVTPAENPFEVLQATGSLLQQ